MVLAPTLKRLPYTVRDAVAVPPEPASAAVPREVLPSKKEICPEGDAAPEEALTVAVITVVILVVMDAGLAVADAVVPAMAALAETLTTTVPEEAPNPLPPE